MAQQENGPIANVDMAAGWDGPEGEHWAAHADSYDRGNRRIWARLLAVDPVRPGDRVLDIGCGNGRSTREVARLASPGSALGVDLSAAMLDVARQRAGAEGLTNVEFLRADAQVHPFGDASFDVAISVFGVMFFENPVAAMGNIARALRPGGRVVFLVWRALADNEWAMTVRRALDGGRNLPAATPPGPGPFAFGDDEVVREIFEQAGFTDVAFEPVDEPLDLGADADAAYAFVSEMGMVRALAAELDDETRARVLDALRETLSARATEDGVLVGTAAWLVTAQRP